MSRRVLTRLTLQTRSKSFGQWVLATQNAIRIAQRNALEKAVEQKFRTKLYSSFSSAQMSLRGELLDEESLLDMLKESKHEKTVLEETLQEARKEIDALNLQAASLVNEVAESRQGNSLSHPPPLRNVPGATDHGEEANRCGGV